METTEHIHDLARRFMLRYGREVVESRSIPDFRDGMKPSQRAILWAMHDLGITNKTGYKKSARVVGEVIGCWWPHSDMSIYKAMVLLANMPIPLIDGYGGWGNHVDPAGAPRYCFAGTTRVMTEHGLVPIVHLPMLENQHNSLADDYATLSGYKHHVDCQVGSLHGSHPASHWLNSGQQFTVTVTTPYGSVVCTPNQPFLVRNGTIDGHQTFAWVTAENLVAGSSRICLNAGSVPVVSGAGNHSELGFLLGVRLFFQNITLPKSHGVHAKWCQEQLDSVGSEWRTILDSENGFAIPEYLFTANHSTVASFLQPLVWQTPPPRLLQNSVTKCRISTTLPNPVIAGQVQQLLGNYFGVWAKLQDNCLFVTKRRCVLNLLTRVYANSPVSSGVSCKCKASCDRDYVLATVTSVVPNHGKQWVYDLTVPHSHAFMANGFLSHNTECRLSDYTQLQMLDSTYLAVTPKIKNFSEDKTWPLVLPAKLPTLLLVGSNSIAVGVSASCPSFELAGVVKLCRKLFKIGAVTPVDCAKYLRLSYKWGGSCVSSPAEMLEFFTTGNATLKFEPEIVLVPHKRQIKLLSVCPGLQSKPVIDKVLFVTVANLPGVKSVADTSDQSGISYTISCLRTADLTTVESQVRAAVTRSVCFDLGITERTEDGRALFSRETIPSLLAKWREWRLGLELAVIDHLLAQEHARLARQNLLLTAVSNLDIVIGSLRSKNPAAHLVKNMGVSQATAEAILELQVKQLHVLERTTIKSAISAIDTKIAALKLERRDPCHRVLQTLAALTA